MKYLIVVDMQKDFVDGALGSTEAATILPAVNQKIDSFAGNIIYTLDTHEENYLNTQEGKNLPIPHCIRNSDGWQLHSSLHRAKDAMYFEKPTFGSTELASYLSLQHEKESIEMITLIGLCTDICIISNALLLKASLPEVPICVDSSCCAGVTPDSHIQALNAMKMCQIIIQ